ncbi:MAG: tRNA (N6-isopentenyl adenosine(37)-C2)-methylthiotransferase MiaB [Flavobacteriales bacterium]|jgi:tRNA-2-methylthio-N6-dimethylallyladenosine synthase|nr:tRNA (N6-isopentenyl adenosine(37)-C2)-methylthiotransferase MiaB [Flavobacteriales bacterium]MBT5090385.1 tRNA (N6-isopentenyl adenosine(37)-C2)-methylthiotransferase MiaB [Flavobacteriales bacterium]MBT5750961.1 tRNA (N6-isopentenyl adenosine(37)-C2)-methylthiotransferase MiaB [Flavobacteriales bacterium]MBT6809139.1 tRNA (N6-isopentenyl adenosine(37)-C2)-methylthiotransferase MiaB [Flavobacteriales bacterium]
MSIEKLLQKNIDESKQGEILQLSENKKASRKMYIESYGCQMNFSDSEIVASILDKEGFSTTKNITEADLVFVNTCSIREKAELTVRKRLEFYNSIKRDKNPSMLVGVLGCMAERLKEKFLEEEKLVDIVVGPDSYRDLPNLIAQVEDGRKAVNVFLSLEETYADINPVRLGGNGVTAFVSITRGCDNMCTFCVVPYTRGRERSRNPESILKECQDLFNDGYREITLLGQNVDSYLWYGGGAKKDFKKVSADAKENSLNFANLLDKVAQVNPKLRVRFSTSNPQDMRVEVIDTMSKYINICDHIHLPVQSGSSRILKLMNRGYDREEYFKLVDDIKERIPNCAISMDMIIGFCSETEEDHKKTLSLMDYVTYDFGYMFKYSVRPNTPAARMEDDVKEDVKQRRLSEIIKKQQDHSLLHMQEKLGKTFEVLIEGDSKKSDQHFYGRTTHNSAVIFEKGNHKLGEYVMVKIDDCTSATLKGKVI